MESNVVQFSPRKPAERQKVRSKGFLAELRALDREQTAAHLHQLETAPETLTETGKNFILRKARGDAFRDAYFVTNYWRARVDWQHALSLAQERGIGDSNTFAETCYGDSQELLDQWRAALVKQLLTPAHLVNEVAWKQVQLRKGQYKYAGLSSKRLEQIIADDLQWLKDHPTRPTKCV